MLETTAEKINKYEIIKKLHTIFVLLDNTASIMY